MYIFMYIFAAPAYPCFIHFITPTRTPIHPPHPGESGEYEVMPEKIRKERFSLVMQPNENVATLEALQATGRAGPGAAPLDLVVAGNHGRWVGLWVE